MKKYRLHGYINMFQFEEDFMYPIYEFGGEYYFAHGSKYFIKEFIKVKSSYLNKIQVLAEQYGRWYVQIGTEQIYIYRKTEGKLLIGTGYRLLKYIETMKRDSDIMQHILDEYCDDFREDVCQALNPIARYYATGRRKKAVARVFLSAGTGRIVVNKRTADDYFSMSYLIDKAFSPLRLTGTEDAVDLYISVRGGGVSGQAEAIRHGISKVLINFDGQSRQLLKQEGYLTRDPRMKERKKCGLKGARKKPQSSKR